MPKPKDGLTTGRDWSETRGFHPDDALLRRHGFRIVSRAKDVEAIWVRDGIPYKESVAVEFARAEVKDDEHGKKG